MTYIPLEPVEPPSSMISQIGYDHETQTLRVAFHNGEAVYDYPMFTPRDWSAFLDADSKGKHFHRAIKPMFGHRRVKENELEKPCCDHPDRDTCDDSCLPCDEWCCPSSGLSPEAAFQALATGRALGTRLIDRVRQSATPVRQKALEETVTRVVCEHANKEATEDGSIIGCADCGADLSPPADEELVCSACHAVYSSTAHEEGDPCEREGCNDGVLG